MRGPHEATEPNPAFLIPDMATIERILRRIFWVAVIIAIFLAVIIFMLLLIGMAVTSTAGSVSAL